MVSTRRSSRLSASPSSSQNFQQRSFSHPSPLPRTRWSSRQSRCEGVDLDDELTENDAGLYVAAFPYMNHRGDHKQKIA